MKALCQNECGFGHADASLLFHLKLFKISWTRWCSCGMTSKLFWRKERPSSWMSWTWRRSSGAITARSSSPSRTRMIFWESWRSLEWTLQWSSSSRSLWRSGGFTSEADLEAHILSAASHSLFCSTELQRGDWRAAGGAERGPESGGRAHDRVWRAW